MNAIKTIAIKQNYSTGAPRHMVSGPRESIGKILQICLRTNQGSNGEYINK